MRPDEFIVSGLRRLRLRLWQQSRYPPLSVAEVARLNTREAYDLIYRKDDLLAQYLEAGRLAFYEEVADYCAQLVGRLHKRDSLRVADLGCGTGHLLFSLWRRLRSKLSIELWGIDHAPSGIERARELLPESKLIVGDIYSNQLPSDYFDLVLCIETLEHLHRPETAVSEMIRICNPSGKVVITVPNAVRDHWEGHVNFWTASEFRAFLCAHGPCEIVSVNNDRILRALMLNR